MPKDPAQTIFLGIRAEALPARYSIGDAPIYNAGSQRPVYKATRTDTAELVACTKIPKSSLHTLDSVQAFQQVGHIKSYEILLMLHRTNLHCRRRSHLGVAVQGLEAHCKLSGHPGIVELIGAYTDDHFVYVLTELCQGGTLSTVLADGKLSDKDVANIATQAASALNHCHKLGQLHLC